MRFVFREPPTIKRIMAQEPTDPLASPVDDVVESEDTQELEALLLLALLQQYQSTNVKRILRESQATATTDPALLIPFVEGNTQQLIDSLDTEQMNEILAAIGLLGFRNGQTQGNRELTSIESLEIQGQIDQNIRTRILSLLGINPPGTVADDNIDNLAVPHGLDETTFAGIAALIIQAIRQAEIEGRLTQTRIDEIYNQLLGDEVERRAEFIAKDNTSTIFGNASFVTVMNFAPTTKTWGRTTAKNPRADHLAQVGLTIPIDAVFPSGQKWSQEVPGCQCHVIVGFG